MKQFCPSCRRVAEDSNLWCPESFCRAEASPFILDSGDHVGEFEIVSRIVSLPTATIYRAKRSEQPLLLKLAHRGHEEKLKREATFLWQHRHPMLPHLLAAYEHVRINEHYYGKTSVHGHVRYFYVCRHEDGETVRRLLLQNAQPAYLTVCWLIMGLAGVIAFLHQNDICHLALTPDGILVRFDDKNIPRPLLLDLGACTSFKNIPTNSTAGACPLPYMAPELFVYGRIGGATDVYGLGLVLYEMLSGRPAYDSPRQNPATTRERILAGDYPSLHRPDLQGIPDITMRAISTEYHDRFSNLPALAAGLLAFVAPVPPEQNSRDLWLEKLFVVLFILLAVALLITAIAIL